MREWKQRGRDMREQRGTCGNEGMEMKGERHAGTKGEGHAGMREWKQRGRDMRERRGRETRE